MTKHEKTKETALEKLPELETVCKNCDGRGHSRAGAWDKCIPCGGTGYILTPVGDQVLDFLRHHLSQMSSENE